MHYRSRTRGPWKKGETSGNVQRVVSLHADCDGDAVLARLDAVLAERAATPDAPGAKPSYTRVLLGDRNRRLKKLGEEAAELAVACADGDRVRAAEEAADLVYHALVALRALGGGWDDVRLELDKRAL